MAQARRKSIGYRSCYMCNQLATTREHVPPRSLFPPGFREQLITVPSCDRHNSQKTIDDEYIRFVLATSIRANKTSMIYIHPVISRAFDKSPSKRKFLKNISYSPIEGKDTGMIEVNQQRYDYSLKCIARGLYFKELDQQWLEEISIINLGPTVFPKNSSISDQLMEAAYRLEDNAEEIFSEAPKFGENQEIFIYQFIRDTDSGLIYLRMIFYGGVQIVAIFGNHLKRMDELGIDYKPKKLLSNEYREEIE